MRKFSIPKRMIMFMAIPVTFVMGLLGFNETLTTTYYYIPSDKVTSNLKIIHISDLHGTEYGENQVDLLDRVKAMKPDIIILTGDIIDDYEAMEPSTIAMSKLKDIAPTYYVTGNHEWWYRDISYLLLEVEKTGVYVVEDNTHTIDVRGDKIAISGIGDPFKYGSKSVWANELHELNKTINPEVLNLLLTHRPEEAELYGTLKMDVAFAGHAHGGQVRVPGLINGLFSPNQGLFPKFAGGDYVLENGSHLVVSRGMSINKRLPRIFNPPEIVVVEIVPEK